MTDYIPPSRAALTEALSLAEELLRNIELGEIPLSRAALKASRLARILNDFEHQKIFEYEAGGYPSGPNGIPPEVWALATKAGRLYHEEKEEGSGSAKTKVMKEYCYRSSIADLEQNLRTLELSLSVPIDSVWERGGLKKGIAKSRARLSSRESFVHSYVSERYHELKFSEIAEDIFSRTRERVDRTIGAVVPTAVKKLSAIYENLSSDNPEDWSNAVHGCRRLLQDLADAVFPPTDDRPASESKPAIRLGPDNYINRLIAFIEKRSESGRFRAIVGSSLHFMGDRLDAAFQAAQKGSHDTILDRDEAERYVIYTYMIVGDILSLLDTPDVDEQGERPPATA